MICGVCGNYNPADAQTCLRCGNQRMKGADAPPAAPALAVRSYQLGGLANALTVMFPIIALLLIVQIFIPPTAPADTNGIGVHIRGLPAIIVGLMSLVAVIFFLIWFYRARQNVGWSTWPQSRSAGWAIWGWFLPPVLLWFPYQIMCDIWRAGRSPDQRQGSKPLAIPAWWATWVFAWITSFQHRTVTSSDGFGDTITNSNYMLDFGGTRLSAAFAAVAAILLVVIIRKVSAGPVGDPLAQPERSASRG